MSDNKIEERNEAFDSAMREKLSGYEPPVPHALWSRISAELNETETEVKHTIPLHVATPSRWKIAIAAAIVLTLGAGSLLYHLNTKNELNTTISAVPKAATAPVSASAPVIEAPIASVALPVGYKASAPAAKSIKKATIVPAAVDNNTTNNTQTATEDSQLASTPPATENNPVELGNIPVYSLNKLTAPAQLNDEITVIKSATVKKKHHRHSDEESTKVIMLGKKYDSAPDIRYQVPVRF